MSTKTATAESVEPQEPRTVVIKASICETNDLEVTPHGMGVDLAQNGLVIHIENSQTDELVRVLQAS